MTKSRGPCRDQCPSLCQGNTLQHLRSLVLLTRLHVLGQDLHIPVPDPDPAATENDPGLEVVATTNVTTTPAQDHAVLAIDDGVPDTHVVEVALAVEVGMDLVTVIVDMATITAIVDLLCLAGGAMKGPGTIPRQASVLVCLA